jgi:hypothetical protein
MEKYLCWFAHAEPYTPYKTMVGKTVGYSSRSRNMHGVIDDNHNSYRNMVMDVMRMNQGYVSEYPITDKEPNVNATRFFLSFERF